MERRTFITAAAATPLLATEAEANTHDPIVALVADWFEARDLWYNYVEDNDCEHRSGSKEAALWCVRDDLAGVICRTKATTLRGVSEQLRYFIAEFGEEFHTVGLLGSRKILPCIKAGIDELNTNSGARA